jgi:DNA (cytosine-5)-methyltransferase 1
MKALSLFSGIGGLDLAFEAAGGHVAAMCEKDGFCRKVLRKHWPDVPIFEDVYDLTGDMVREVIGHGRTIDVIYGGFPCQSFSVAGNQKGRDDDRYLWPEFSRLVGEIRPRWVVAENVPGILNLAADDVCSDLERLDYSVGVWCYEAAAVGAPHRRMRVFFVAHPRRRMREGRPIAEALCGEHEGGAAAYPERPGSPPFPDAKGDGRHEGIEIAGGREEGSEPGARDRPSLSRPNFPYSDSAGKSQQGGDILEVGGRAGDSCGRFAEPGMGGVVDGLPPWLDGYWRSEPDIPRTARGVPDREQRLKALGNAVVPAQIELIFEAVMKADRKANFSDTGVDANG